MKKLKNWIIGLFSALGAIFVLFLTFKKKNPKEIKKVEENKKEIISIKSDLDNLKKTKSKAQKKVKDLEKTADGRSKKVQAARREASRVNNSVSAILIFSSISLFSLERLNIPLRLSASKKWSCINR